MCLDDFGRRRPVVLQHVLDQIDAPARRIELVAVEHIGRTSRGAEAAMHAGAQDLFRFRDIRIGKLREREGGLHASYTPAHMRPAIEHALRIEALAHPLGQCRQAPAASGVNTSTAARTAAGARISVAWPPAAATVARTSGALRIVRGRQCRPDEPAGPVVEKFGVRLLGKRAADFGAARAAPSKCARGRARPRDHSRRTARRRGPRATARARLPRRACQAHRTAHSSVSQHGLALRHRWRDAFEAECGHGGVRARQSRRCAPRPSPADARPRTRRQTSPWPPPWPCAPRHRRDRAPAPSPRFRRAAAS